MISLVQHWLPDVLELLRSPAGALLFMPLYALWVTLLLPVKVGAVVLSLCFLAALHIDQKLFREQIWPVWMRPLRLHLSLVAVASLTTLAL